MGAASVVPLSLLLPDPLLPDPLPLLPLPLLPPLLLLPWVGLGIGAMSVVDPSVGSGIGATLVVLPSVVGGIGATSVVPPLVVSSSSSSHAGPVNAIASDAPTSTRPRGLGVNLVLLLITTRSIGTHRSVRGQVRLTANRRGARERHRRELSSGAAAGRGAAPNGAASGSEQNALLTHALHAATTVRSRGHFEVSGRHAGCCSPRRPTSAL